MARESRKGGVSVEQESGRVVDCCGGLFLAKVAEDRPGELLLECCMCGRPWRRQRDGTLVPHCYGTPPDKEGD